MGEIVPGRFFTIWSDMWVREGLTLRELQDPGSLDDHEWADPVRFWVWLEAEERKTDTPALAVVAEDSDYLVGPENYVIVRAKPAHTGGKRIYNSFQGVDFVWDPARDRIDTPHGRERIRQARAAGASVRDCANIFGIDRDAMHRRIRDLENPGWRELKKAGGLGQAKARKTETARRAKPPKTARVRDLSYLLG